MVVLELSCLIVVLEIKFLDRCCGIELFDNFSRDLIVLWLFWGLICLIVVLEIKLLDSRCGIELFDNCYRDYVV